jgi:hypothetical protein
MGGYTIEKLLTVDKPWLLRPPRHRVRLRRLPLVKASHRKTPHSGGFGDASGHLAVSNCDAGSVWRHLFLFLGCRAQVLYKWPERGKSKFARRVN